MTEMLYRAANVTHQDIDVSADGRTMEGVAFYFDHASRVTDDGQSYYLEKFSPGSVTKTLKEWGRVPIPFGVAHPWPSPSDDWDTWEEPIIPPIGDVKFRASREALIFRAQLHETTAADQARDRYLAGELGDVSTGFIPYKNTVADDVVVRTEIRLNELSLAPVGQGLHEGAQVMVLRAIKSRNPTAKQIARDLRLLNLK